MKTCNPTRSHLMFETLESREFFSVAPVPSVGVTAHAQPAVIAPVKAAVLQPSTQWNYVGSYTINGVTTTIKLGLVKSYGRAGVYCNVLEGGRRYDAFMWSNYGMIYFNWYVFDANYNQISKGTFAGTYSADGKSLVGTVTKPNGSTGPATLKVV